MLVEVKKVMAISSIPIIVVVLDEAEDVAMDIELVVELTMAMSTVLVVDPPTVIVLISIL